MCPDDHNHSGERRKHGRGAGVPGARPTAREAEIDARAKLIAVSFADAVAGRCSMRRFLPDPVPRGDVEAMVAVAERAASAGNSQPWRFVAVEDEGLRREMAEAVHAALDVMAGLPECRGRARDIRAIRNYATFFADAPVVVAVFVLPYAARSDELLALRGLSSDERDRLRQRPDLQSIGAAVQLLITAAHVMGYGSCWMTAPVLAAPAIEELLAAPAGARLAAVVPIGRPAGRPRHSPRLPVDQVLSWR
ncbi:MAG TPA: nitroreductase family protein [Thermoleophilia bacterium]|nr:nitroreductase family protein [Thermoleophilia bacterium]HQG03133.1 nitroreductase family protein [Thermoleophilia bacterium]HQJ97839.1 nitroreductase family protein [Thermoleophilia bacterium]